MEHANHQGEMNTAERLSVLLVRCGQKLGSRGAGQTQGRILKILYLHGPMTQKELQDKLAIQPGSMSEIAAKLEHRGLILRQKDQTDKRKIFLSLTEAGRADVEAFRAHKKASKRFDALSPEEQASLQAMLETLLDSWEQNPPEY